MDPVNDNWARRARRQMRRFEAKKLAKLGRRLPDFLVIGAQKSGTSWLHQNLIQHPEVFVPQKKELHYFNSDLCMSLPQYANFFADAGDRVVGEITPAYSILADADIRFIHSLMPKAKLILLMRDPIDRAWSQAVMEVADRTGRKIEEVADKEFATFLKSWPSFARSDYPTMLKNWEKHFDPTAILTGFLDEVRSQPEVLLNSIFAHIGVKEIQEWQGYPVRKVVAPDVGKTDGRGAQAQPGFAIQESSPAKKVSTESLMPESIRDLLIEMYREVLEQMTQRFGASLPDWHSAQSTR